MTTMEEHWAQVGVDYARLIPHFEQFVGPGDLVVDAGAQVGAYTWLFLECGAQHVVAVEPLVAALPTAVEPLIQRYGDDPRVTILPVALSSRPGKATLRFSPSPTRRFPSISQDWMRNSLHAPYYGPDCVDFEVEVQTLDDLIERAGAVPRFIKIDCEGSSGDVVAGLSTPVPALNAELHRDYIRDAWRVAEHMNTLGDYEWNFALGTGTSWEWPAWGNAGELLRYLERRLAFEGGEAWGDLYCRIPRRGA